MNQFENSLAWKMQHARASNYLFAGPGPGRRQNKAFLKNFEILC
jgi:hypothetical protein